MRPTRYIVLVSPECDVKDYGRNWSTAWTIGNAIAEIKRPR